MTGKINLKSIVTILIELSIYILRIFYIALKGLSKLTLLFAPIVIVFYLLVEFSDICSERIVFYTGLICEIIGISLALFKILHAINSDHRSALWEEFKSAIVKWPKFKSSEGITGSTSVTLGPLTASSQGIEKPKYQDVDSRIKHLESEIERLEALIDRSFSVLKSEMNGIFNASEIGRKTVNKEFDNIKKKISDVSSGLAFVDLVIFPLVIAGTLLVSLSAEIEPFISRIYDFGYACQFNSTLQTRSTELR